jgi:hypothetical protein
MAGKVTVACKHPAGLVLKVYKKFEDQEVVIGGGSRAVVRHEAMGEAVHLKGYYPPQDGKKLPLAATSGEYALTYDVDEDFMLLWLEQNADNPLVKNRIVLVNSNTNSVKAAVRENDATKSGFEPLNPDDLPKTARSVTGFKAA